MNCRICNCQTSEILDLGSTPPANSLLTVDSISQEEYPLILEYCEECNNLQLRDCLSADDLYKDYLYVTPNSSMLDGHYKYLTDYLFKQNYVTNNSFVVEVGSNIGYYLNYLKPKVEKVLGIDPAENICEMANLNGIETICDFFNAKSAKFICTKYGKPDVIMARHCFAHNEDPHELMKGLKELLPLSGRVVIENAYALNTIENKEFDQIYHEHMFYYSIRSMTKLLKLHGLVLVDVLISLVHGGSIIFIAEHFTGQNQVNSSVSQYLANETIKLNRSTLLNFSKSAHQTKSDLLKLINKIKIEGKKIFSYGATAKGNTLLNFCGITNNDIPFCVDNTEIKIGKFLPKSKIQIISESVDQTSPPDYFLLTAWNYKDEIIGKVRESGNYHSKFIVPFPVVHII